MGDLLPVMTLTWSLVGVSRKPVKQSYPVQKEKESCPIFIRASSLSYTQQKYIIIYLLPDMDC
jgi:hypothetical protein